MIEDDPWIGSNYGYGALGEKRVAIVGWSHHANEGDMASDTPEARGTIQCIEKVISGEWRIRFFTQLRNCFGYSQHEAFWPHVVFFNYLPTAVPTRDKFSHGSVEQRVAAQDRFRRIVREQEPRIVVIFTRRGWAFDWAFPEPENSLRGIGSEFPDYFGYRIYNHRTPVFFLRHPQGAPKLLMRRATERILSEAYSVANANGQGAAPR